MPLDLIGLETNLGAAFDATQVAAPSAEEAKANFVKAMSIAIDTYVRSATIEYVGGLSAPGGLVEGTFLGGLE